MNMHSDEDALRKLSTMTKHEQLVFLCGGRVTVANIQQVKQGEIVTSYMPKIRGVVIGNKGEGMFGTEKEARDRGDEIMARWRAELAELSDKEAAVMELGK